MKARGHRRGGDGRDGDPRHGHPGSRFDEREHGPRRHARTPPRGMPPEEHRRQAPTAVKAYVITVSDSRTAADDTSGAAIARLLAEAGHAVLGRACVPDDAEKVRAAVREAPEEADAILLTGGTGVAPRDVTLEALEPLWEKRLPGFGELFRALSARQIGPAAWLSRAAAGTVAGGRLLFALPGAPAAVELALEELILPELGHAVGLARPPAPPEDEDPGGHG